MTGPHDDLAPSAWIERFALLVSGGGTVLDVACGTGRHCRYFLAAGRKVVGVDRYNAGIVDLLGTPGFEFVDANLEIGRPWPFDGRKFDAIVVTNYLYRPLLPTLAESLAQGGVLLYETFAKGNERYSRPSNPDFLLDPGELLAAYADRLQIVAYEHGIVHRPSPAVVQRICAVDKAVPLTLPEPGTA